MVLINNITDNQVRKRNSNLELYRIIVMLLIVAHHYVVNSGLSSFLREGEFSLSSSVMMLFGAWGKTGINCFVLITGYFMCKSVFSARKLLKLYLQIVFYSILIYSFFCITGHETFNPVKAAFKLFPIHGIGSDFTSCFLLFYLFIPFLNLLVKALDKRMHGYLVLLLVFVYTILPSMGPLVTLTFNYVEWFIVLYFISSYLRLYGKDFRISHAQWGIALVVSLIISSFTVLAMFYFWHAGIVGAWKPYFFISDSNKILALTTAVSSFMWFKDLKIKYIPFINIVAATTFGVLLIHANSDAMRQWLWRETVDCVGNFSASVWLTVGYASVSVFTIFTICSVLEWLRSKIFEKKLLKIVEGLFRNLKKVIFLPSIYRN